MRNKVVTVFGGSGFIGRYVVQRLAELGATIRVPTRRPERALFLKPMGAIGQINLLRWSPSAPGEVGRLLAGAEAAVSLVGILHESRAGEFERLQADLPREVGAAGARLGLERVVHVSAIGARAGSPVAYARTKAAGEEGVKQAFPEATILRPSIVFGPEDSFFNRFARMAQLSPALPLIGGGRTRFQPVYVGDVADAILAGLTRPDAQGRTYELGGPTVYTFKELMAYLLRVTGRRRLLLDVPFGLASFQAKLLQHLPDPPLTPDQVEMLKHDNVVGHDAAGLADLGVQPTPLEVIVPQYLKAYARPGVHLPVI
ncbi:MAG TPA: complex I NDUFA9 subunit family protein [Geminicoccaceae bacterium]|nr:complex I NDUFA9 subunit family protein [Geminicoccaceae bacterium]